MTFKKLTFTFCLSCFLLAVGDLIHATGLEFTSFAVVIIAGYLLGYIERGIDDSNN